MELRAVAGYEGIYAVTESGRVWALPRTWFGANGGRRAHAGMWLQLSRDGQGYLRVRLCKAGRLTTHKVHRLVAEAWVPNPSDLPVVNHLNGIKDDNRAANLQWCTDAVNNQHAWDTGLRRSTPAMQAAMRRAQRAGVTKRKAV